MFYPMYLWSNWDDYRQKMRGKFRESIPLYSGDQTFNNYRKHILLQAALLEKCWRISLYVTDDAIAKLYSMWRKVSSNRGNSVTW